MSLPHVVRKTITLPGSEAFCVEVDVPARGIIRTLIVTETVGPGSGFQFDLFDKREVCPPTVDDEGVVHSSSSSEPGSTAPRVLHSVIGRKAEAGKTFEERDQRYIYETEGGSTNRSRKLYLEIDPTGADDPREYELRLDVEMPTL